MDKALLLKLLTAGIDPQGFINQRAMLMTAAQVLGVEQLTPEERKRLTLKEMAAIGEYIEPAMQAVNQKVADAALKDALEYAMNPNDDSADIKIADAHAFALVEPVVDEIVAVYREAFKRIDAVANN